MPKMQCMILSGYSDLSWFVWRRAPLEDLDVSPLQWSTDILLYQNHSDPVIHPSKHKFQLGIKLVKQIWYITSITDTNCCKVCKVRSTLHSSRIVAVLVPDPDVLQHLDTQTSCILPHVTCIHWNYGLQNFHWDAIQNLLEGISYYLYGFRFRFNI